MAIETPHLKWPFSMSGVNKSNMGWVDQDDDVEVEQCVAFVLATEQGTLVGAPYLGIPDPTFKPLGVPEPELAAVIGALPPDELLRRAT